MQLVSADVLLFDSRHATFLMHEGTKVMAKVNEDETLMTRCAHGPYTLAFNESQAFVDGEATGRATSAIIEHITNPEFKCVSHVIKYSLHFNAITRT